MSFIFCLKRSNVSLYGLFVNKLMEKRKFYDISNGTCNLRVVVL